MPASETGRTLSLTGAWGRTKPPKSPEPALSPHEAEREREEKSAYDGHRIDALDGIRALAVMVVLLFHVNTPGFAAGFLGVDLFFVLSGFLITGLLVNDVRKYQRVRFGTFYTRRVKRLLPASVLVIMVVVIVGSFGLRFEREALYGDALSSLFYVANWHFISGASYFESDGTVSPLLHFWSLAVEEQFYFVWPFLIAGIVWLTRRLGKRGHNPVMVTAGVAIALSIGSLILLAVLFNPESPERAYMGTDSRAFEPLMGAALACLVTLPSVRERITKVAGPLMWVGTVGFLACVALLGSGAGESGISPVYFHGGALVAASFALLLVLGAAFGRRAGIGKAYTWRPIVALGRISFGVYLWHWPLVVWLGKTDLPAFYRGVIVLVGSIALATASYWLIEQPIRYGRLSPHITARRVAIGLPIVLATCAVVTWAVLVGPLARGLPNAGAAGTGVDNRASKEPLKVMLVGDSVPKRLFPFAATEGARMGIDVYDAARGACPANGSQSVDVDGKPFSEDAQCTPNVTDIQGQVLQGDDPNTIIWWSRYEGVDRLDNGQHLTPDDPKFWDAQRRDLDAAVKRMTANGATVVFVATDPPGEGMYTRCTPDDCKPILKRMLERDDIRQKWNSILAEYAAAHPEQTRYITMSEYYCLNRKVPCDDTWTDGQPARPDGTHFSEVSGPVIARELLDRAREAVTTPPMPVLTSSDPMPAVRVNQSASPAAGSVR